MPVRSLTSSSSACWLLALAWRIFVPRPCHAFSAYQWINSHLCGWTEPDPEGWVLLYTCYAARWQKVTLLIRGWINKTPSCDYWSHCLLCTVLGVTTSGFSSFCLCSAQQRLVPALLPVMIFKMTVLTLCPRLQSVFFLFLFLYKYCQTGPTLFLVFPALETVTVINGCVKTVTVWRVSLSDEFIWN